MREFIVGNIVGNVGEVNFSDDKIWILLNSAFGKVQCTVPYSAEVGFYIMHRDIFTTRDITPNVIISKGHTCMSFIISLEDLYLLTENLQLTILMNLDLIV